MGDIIDLKAYKDRKLGIDSSIAERIARIKASLERIRALSEELRPIRSDLTKE